MRTATVIAAALIGVFAMGLWAGGSFERKVAPATVAPVTAAAPAAAVVAARDKSDAPYHRPICEWAQKIGSFNRQYFDSASAAQSAGRKPCRVCQP